MNTLFDSCVTFNADQDTIKYFTEGQCNALAYELNKLTDWLPVMVSNKSVSNDYIGHLAVITNNDLVVDIEGMRELDVFLDRWKTVEFDDWYVYQLNDFYRFRSAAEFKREMRTWKNDIPYTKDLYAKKWAQYIVDCLS